MLRQQQIMRRAHLSYLAEVDGRRLLEDRLAVERSVHLQTPVSYKSSLPPGLLRDRHA